MIRTGCLNSLSFGIIFVRDLIVGSKSSFRRKKADRALVISMALAGALSRSGERCGALGGGRGAVSGARAPSRVGEDIREFKPDMPFPRAPRDTAAVVVCSDFYSPLEFVATRCPPVGSALGWYTQLWVPDDPQPLHHYQ
jgi:hypothetical protein